MAKLTKVNHIGYSYFHRFKMDDGSFVEVETTQEDYRQLGTSTPINPTITGGTWVHSYERLKFDTPTGLLSDGEYADIEGRYKYVKPIGKAAFSVPSNFIKNDLITTDAQTKIDEWEKG